MEITKLNRFTVLDGKVQCSAETAVVETTDKRPFDDIQLRIMDFSFSWTQSPVFFFQWQVFVLLLPSCCGLLVPYGWTNIYKTNTKQKKKKICQSLYVPFESSSVTREVPVAVRLSSPPALCYLAWNKQFADGKLCACFACKVDNLDVVAASDARDTSRHVGET